MFFFLRLTAVKEDKFGFVNLSHNNCKNPLVLIKDEEFGRSVCLQSNNFDDGLRFKTCNSSKTEQQWAILKTENDQHDYIRLCQRVKIRSFDKYFGSSATHHCLGANPYAIPLNAYQKITYLNDPSNPFFKKSKPIEPNEEVRVVGLLPPPDEGDKWRVEWKMNSTTHQLANVEYPKVCMTSRHADPRNEFALLLQCNNSESPNPQLPQNQRFYEIPVIDKNEEQLCSD